LILHWASPGQPYARFPSRQADKSRRPAGADGGRRRDVGCCPPVDRRTPIRYATAVRVIGLTGGIGSGKSTVADILEALGAKVIRADSVGHEAYRPRTQGWQRVTEAFGRDILAPDGSIDRRKLGAIVFGDAQARAQLNAIVHPLIAAEVRRRIEAHRAAGSLEPIVVEAAVLIEAGWLSLVDEVWLVVSDLGVVIDRLVKQRCLAPDEAKLRIASQLDDAERQRYAHVVIHNTGSIEELREQVRALWKRSARL
jgi:dephospho-CoA kinase